MSNCKSVARIRRHIRDVFSQTRKDTMQIFVSSAFFLQIDTHLKSRGNNRSNAPEVLRICSENIIPVYALGSIYFHSF